MDLIESTQLIDLFASLAVSEESSQATMMEIDGGREEKEEGKGGTREEENMKNGEHWWDLQISPTPVWISTVIEENGLAAGIKDR